MLGFDIIKKLMRRYRLQLSITYSLYLLEMSGALLRPFFLGLAVNDLIKGSYHGLIILCLVHFAWLLIGTARHMIDTRTYTNIYTALVTQFLTRRSSNKDVSKLSAHSTLSRELVDFLESDLTYIIEAVFNIFGSMVLLFFYNKMVVLICLSMLLPVCILGFFYGKKMSALNQLKNDELEKQVSVIAMGNDKAVKKHYNNLKKWQIKISDKEAINFGFIELIVLIIIAASLLISSKTFGITMLAGSLIGIYNYILKFVSGLDTIPYAIQKIASLKDIANRIEIHADDLVAPTNPNNTPEQIYIQGSLKLTA